MNVLVFNCGSSSLKASLLRVESSARQAQEPELWKASAGWGRTQDSATFRVAAEGATLESTIDPFTHRGIVTRILDSLKAYIEAKRGETKTGELSVDVVGHRIVFGGKNLHKTVVITPEIIAEIERLAEFAPEHNPLAAAAIRGVEDAFGPRLQQVAVFDTAFHAGMPREAAVYPGPYEWVESGIERFGFHGISHRYLSRRAAEILGKPLESLRLVTCHLGNGCSLAAVREGRSVDTTMGFTPMEGLAMGTRSGTVDPGILIYLMRTRGYDAGELDHLLNHDSGLKGLSGISGDMRDILDAMRAGNERAKLAFDVYVHRLCREIGSMIGSLGGVDALIFGGGVGENSPLVREIVAERFGFLGVKIDREKYSRAHADAIITAADSKVHVLAIRTEEDWEIARECFATISNGTA